MPSTSIAQGHIRALASGDRRRNWLVQAASKGKSWPFRCEVACTTIIDALPDPGGRVEIPPDAAGSHNRTSPLALGLERAPLCLRARRLSVAEVLPPDSSIPLKVVSDLLGHSRISITPDLCQHVRQSMHENAAEVLTKAIGTLIGPNGAGNDKGTDRDYPSVPLFVLSVGVSRLGFEPRTD